MIYSKEYLNMHYGDNCWDDHQPDLYYKSYLNNHEDVRMAALQICKRLAKHNLVMDKDYKFTIDYKAVYSDPCARSEYYIYFTFKDPKTKTFLILNNFK